MRNRYNGEVNGYFLCDRGRFGYEFVNSDRRIRQPLLRTGNGEAATPSRSSLREESPQPDEPAPIAAEIHAAHRSPEPNALASGLGTGNAVDHGPAASAVGSDDRNPIPSGQRRGAACHDQPTSRDDALSHIAEILKHSPALIGIGSPRASLESNFTQRELVGAEKFCPGFSARDHELVAAAVRILKAGPARTPSLHDVEPAAACLSSVKM